MDISRRIGQFRIAVPFIKEYAQVIMSEVMAHCIVVRAEMMWDQDCMEYVALSPLFDSVEAGQITPHYDVEITGPNARFVRRA